MQALTPLTNGLRLQVQGYRAPGDQGGGVFRYDATNAAPVDGGAVLAPARGPGRFLRVTDPGEEAYAEWFGAYGDGQHPDQMAINACLAAYGKVRLLARTYAVRGRPEPYNPNISYHAIDLAPGWRIEGAGRTATRIRLLDGTNPGGPEPGNNYFRLLANRAFHESADDLVIRDLTLDANFDGQNRQTTISAIHIRGGNALVERVNFRGYGTGRHPATGSSRECFVVYQTLLFKDSKASRRAATLRDLDFTDAGHNGDLPGHFAEITHISIGGANNFDNAGWVLASGRDPAWDPAEKGENERNWWPSQGGLIEGCFIHDVTRDPRQKSALNAITYSDCIGLTIRSNRVERFDGLGVYVMSWWNQGTTMVENQFLDVENGFSLQLTANKGEAVEAPQHEDVLVARNTVRTGQPKYSEWGTRGFLLYGQEVGAGLRFKNITVRDNTLSGRAFTDVNGRRICPRGFVFQVRGANYEGIRVYDNIIDMPDLEKASYVPEIAGSLSLTFFPMARWADDAKAGRVVFRGNRTPDGKRLEPILADWDYKNAPFWGRPEGAVSAKGVSP